VTDPDPVNLAFGTRVSLLELIDLLGDVIGHPLPCRHTEPRAGDVRDSQADQSRIRRLFPDIEPVALEAGLQATVEWFRKVS
jgi:UDP-glucose 4-epimerase